jgi:hypothetical protein
LLHEARVAALIDGIATGLAKLPEGTRASLGADGTSVRLTVARAVTCEKPVRSVGETSRTPDGTTPQWLGGRISAKLMRDL